MKSYCYVKLLDLLYSGSENCQVLAEKPKDGKYLIGVKEGRTISLIYNGKLLTKRTSGLPGLMTWDLEVARHSLLVAK